MKKPRGRHAIDPNEPVLEPIEDMDLRLTEQHGDWVIQYVVFGEPGHEPQIAEQRQTPLQAHPPAELTDSIAAVRLTVHGDGSTSLQVYGYDEQATREEWRRAVMSIGGYRINDEAWDQGPVPAFDPVSIPATPPKIDLRARLASTETMPPIGVPPTGEQVDK